MIHYDDIIVAGGHNGADLCGLSGPRWAHRPRPGRSGSPRGAAISARALAGVDAKVSRYSYLSSPLMPHRVMADLGPDVTLLRRRYCSFTPLPTRPAQGLLIDNGDETGTAMAFTTLTGSDAEFGQWQRFHDRMTSLARLLFPTVLEPFSVPRSRLASSLPTMTCGSRS